MIIDLLKSLTSTEFEIVAYIAIVAILVAVDGRSRSAWAPRGMWATVPIAFLMSSLALILFARRDALRYDPIINPDEALMAANAMLTRHGWLNWNIVDPTTSGPLNSLILAWPYLFGGDITLFSTRLTGLVCVFTALAFLFLALRRLSDDCTAIIATAPAIVFFAAPRFLDFISYSSEQFPILLLGLAIYLFVHSFDANRLGYLVGAAVVLGLVPFAKLQAAPMAAALGAFVLARAVETGLRSGGRLSAVRRTAIVAGAAALPALILVVPLALSGGVDDLLKSYFIQQWLRAGSPSNIGRLWLLAGTPIFRALLEAYAAMFSVAIISIALSARRVGARPTIAAVVPWTVALCLVLVPVAFVSIALPGRAYTHYLLLAVPALVALVGVVLAVASLLVDACSRRSALQRWLTLGVPLAILLPTAQQDGSFIRMAGGAFLMARPFTAAHNLAWLRPTGDDRMVCWGWRAECYVDAAIPPATREATNENQLYETALRPYFRSRFLADFARNRPAFVIDVVAPGSFKFTEPEEQGIGDFPEFAKIIAGDFDLVSRVDPPSRCPRLYVRRTRLAEFNRSRIAFAGLTATASIAGHPPTALDDGSIFETCDDNWLLPKGMLGTATIDFQKAGRLGTVAILNTRNGIRGDYASDRVRLSVRLAGKTIAVGEVTLEPFPRWTYSRFGQLVSDGLTIEILTYRREGGGLNEVKAYRD
jgi:hypothetical protein